MLFETVYHQPRPMRLSEQTRKFAYDSLHHKYGLDTKKTPFVSLDSIPDFEKLSELQKYNRAIREIAEKAPVRLCEGERISGAATLSDAITHRIPVRYQSQHLWSSISHLTLNYEKTLKYGFFFVQKEIREQLEKQKNPEKREFLLSLSECADAFCSWHRRYLEALKEKENYRKNYENLLQVPMRPARNFHEAVQSIWFVFAFNRLCGNWPGIGRLDYLLGAYLKKDLQEGVLTLEEAREILAHFFIKGCEWICGGDYGSGDAQHYQNIVLAGVDEHGQEITNEVTYLALDILEEFGISDFPTTVRVGKHTPQRLLRRVAEVVRHGGGILAVYNEDLIIEALTDYGYPLNEARLFANDGCWEVQIPGKTQFIYVPFDALAIFQQTTLKGYQNIDFDSFDALYEKFREDLRDTVERIFQNSKAGLLDGQVPAGDWNWKKNIPCSVVSLFEDGCAEHGRSYLEGGPEYVVNAPHIGGMPDVANSLYAIKKIVFDEKRRSFPEFMDILRNNWENQENLRQWARNRLTYYGNDNPEVDEIAAQILNDFAEMCHDLEGRIPIKFPAGVSTFGRQLEWSGGRLATPFGKKAGEILAANQSPTPGTDKKGATAIIKSYCRADLKKLVNGTALDLKLFPTVTRGEEGIAAITSLIQGFITLGGFFLQPDVIDSEILLEAQRHPENYQTLSVRVSGWNARFVTLNKEWQDMIIGQTGKGAGE